MSSSHLGLICLESEPASLINPSGALWVFVSVQGFGIPAPSLSITPLRRFQERQKRVKKKHSNWSSDEHLVNPGRIRFAEMYCWVIKIPAEVPMRKHGIICIQADPWSVSRVGDVISGSRSASRDERRPAVAGSSHRGPRKSQVFRHVTFKAPSPPPASAPGNVTQ